MKANAKKEYWRLYAEEKTTSESLVDPFHITCYDYEIIDVAILTQEEKDEFETNLWVKYKATDHLKDAKSIYDVVKQAAEKPNLKDFGIKVKQVMHDGELKYLITNFKSYLKTLLRGVKFRANTPSLSLVATNLATGFEYLKKNTKGTILGVVIFSGGMNALNVVADEKKTMADWFGDTGLDVAVGIGSLAISTAAGAILGISSPLAILVGAVIVGFELNSTMNELGLSEKVSNALKEFWEDCFDNEESLKSISDSNGELGRHFHLLSSGGNVL